MRIHRERIKVERVEEGESCGGRQLRGRELRRERVEEGES